MHVRIIFRIIFFLKLTFGALVLRQSPSYIRTDEGPDARNVSFKTLFGGQFTSPSQLKIQNYPTVESQFSKTRE